jgi:hypothetical protein
MNGHDRPGTGRNLGFDEANIHGPRLGVGIDKYRNRPTRDNRLRTGNDRKRGHNDLVTGCKTQRGDRTLQGSRPVAHGHAMSSTAILGPSLLELLNERSRR